MGIRSAQAFAFLDSGTSSWNRIDETLVQNAVTVGKDFPCRVQTFDARLACRTSGDQPGEDLDLTDRVGWDANQVMLDDDINLCYERARNARDQSETARRR
jgi:hypothetical protein